MKIQFKIIYAHRKEHLNIGELYKRNPLIKTIFLIEITKRNTESYIVQKLNIYLENSSSK